MRDGEIFTFRLFRDDVPGFLRTWRSSEAVARWDRHYLGTPGLGLVLVAGTRVELTRLTSREGFRTEEVALSAAFPLDWMSLTMVSEALPRPFAQATLDGRTAQKFVDSLAFASLPQASVLKSTATARNGAVTATITELSVPDWNTRAISITFESRNAGALRTLLLAAGLRGAKHRDLDDWLSEARRGCAPSAPRPARVA